MMNILRCTFWSVAISLLVFINPPAALGATDAGSVTLPTITPPTIPGGKKAITLPATVDDLDIGGGGRYIALHMKSLRKIAIFDVNQLKITGYVPASDGDTKFAAGATKMIVVSGESGVVARWDLATAKRELAQTIDLGGSAGNAVLGSASAGPVIIGNSAERREGNAFVVDLQTLRTQPINANNVSRGFGPSVRVRMSANGRIMTAWQTTSSPAGLQSYIKQGDKWAGHYDHDTVGYIIPSPDGKLLYTAEGIFSNHLRRVGERKRDTYPIPAQHGPFYLTCNAKTISRDKANETVTLHLEGDSRPLMTIPNLEPAWVDDDKWSRKYLTLEKRLIFIPNANLIIQLDKSKQTLHAIHLDIDAALKKSTVDYLVVTSRPPLQLKAGDKMSYQVDVKSKSGGVKYSLDSAPDGMTISPTGLLTWAPSTRSPAINNVIITVADKSGQQVYHTFDLKVEGGNASAVDGVAAAADGPVQQINTTPAKLTAESTTIKMPGSIGGVTLGGNGRFIFLHLRALKKIAVLDVSKAAITGYLPASDDEMRIVAGATRALIFNPTQGVVSRYRLDTLQRELTTTIPLPGKVDFVGMGAGSEGPAIVRSSAAAGALDRATFHFIDLNTMKPVKVQWDNNRQPHASFRDHNAIQVSTSGKVFVINGAGVFRLEGDRVRIVGNRSHRSAGWPSSDGNYFFTNGQMLNAELMPIGDASARYGIAVPSITGRYFLSINHNSRGARDGNANTQSAKLYIFGDNRPLVTIPDLQVSHNSSSTNHQARIGWNQRVLFVPDAQVIATIPATNDQVVLRKFNIDQALDASGVDYLVVDSSAPLEATPGKPYVYQVNTKSKRGGVKYKLDSAPAAMKISATGRIAWNVPLMIKEDTHKVIVSISDASGQSIYHTFTVELPEVKLRKAAADNRSRIRERAAQAAAQKAAALARQRKLIEERRRAALAQKRNEPAMRTWTGSDVNFKVKAMFVRIEQQKIVVLKLENGATLQIELAKLSSEDIYEAVKSDLAQQHETVPPEEADEY